MKIWYEHDHNPVYRPGQAISRLIDLNGSLVFTDRQFEPATESYQLKRRHVDTLQKLLDCASKLKLDEIQIEALAKEYSL